MFNKEKYLEIQRKIPPGVNIIGVTKTKSAEDIRQAIDAGIKIIAENYVQEAEKKYTELKDLLLEKKVRFDLIGHLQSNKAKKAAEIFDCIQTIDSPKIARVLNKECELINKTIRVMVEVNLGEEQKSGAKEQELEELIEKIKSLENLQLIGLMSIPKVGEELICFKKMKELKERYNLQELSMGMSQDYEEAIENGATLIRLGTILFGERS